MAYRPFTLRSKARALQAAVTTGWLCATVYQGSRGLWAWHLYGDYRGTRFGRLMTAACSTAFWLGMRARIPLDYADGCLLFPARMGWEDAQRYRGRWMGWSPLCWWAGFLAGIARHPKHRLRRSAYR